MAVDYFKCRGQFTFAAQRFVRLLHRPEPRLPRQSRRTRLRDIVRADGLQVAHHRAHVTVGQRKRLHIHYRVGKAALHQNITDVMQIDKTAHMRMLIHARERRTQFLQGIGAERAKH